MTHPDVGCVVNVPRLELSFEYSRTGDGNCVKVPFLGVARRYLSLVTAKDVTIPAFDDASPQVTRVPVYSPDFLGDAIGAVRQTVPAVSTYHVLAARDTCKLTSGLGEVGFCNLSRDPVIIPSGTHIADWQAPDNGFVITMPDGSDLCTPEVIDAANKNVEQPQADPAPAAPVYGDSRTTTEQIARLTQAIEGTGALRGLPPGTFTPSTTVLLSLSQA